MTPADLYQRLRYQLAPVGITTMGACAKGCGNYARGAGTCAACLATELQTVCPRVNWLGFVKRLRTSANAILEADRAVYGGGE